MVAIYIPVLPSADQAQLATHLLQLHPLNPKTAFMLCGLHVYNESKSKQITCLSTAVSCHRRCRNPLHTARLPAVLAEMVEVAEDPYSSLGDLRFVAKGWAEGLSCYLHGSQKDVAMAALWAVAAYRLESEVVAVDGGMPGAWKYALGSVHCAEGFVSLENTEEVAKGVADNVGEFDAMAKGLLETPKCPDGKPNDFDALLEGLRKAAKSPTKKPEESNTVSEGLLNEGKIRQWKELRDLKMALLSLTEAVLKLCASILWLYFNVMLVYLGVSLLYGSK